MKIEVWRDKPDRRFGRHQCIVCHSIFEVEPEDAHQFRFHKGFDRDMREHDWWSIPCPVCGDDTSLAFPLKEGEDRFAARHPA